MDASELLARYDAGERDFHNSVLTEGNLSRANLSGANLIEADLSGADLSRADLSGASLNGANLSKVSLIGADLSGVYLIGADLIGANLRGADLIEANLRGADLIEANLRGADLSEADLSGANLRGADLSGANLRGASLIEANLSGADFKGADLTRVNISGANLDRADLSGAILIKTNLSNANLCNTILERSNLVYAKLIGTDLTAANLTDANLIGANFTDVNLSETKLNGENIVSQTDWTIPLQAIQADFIQRLRLGYLLNCEVNGQHSELSLISIERLKEIRDFCLDIAKKYQQKFSVQNVFIQIFKSKLGEEIVKSCLAELVNEIDYEQRIKNNSKVDFVMASNPSVGIQVKTRYGDLNKIQWQISLEECQGNAVLVCVLGQEEFKGFHSEYGLIMAGFLPTNMIQANNGKALIGMDKLLYAGGLRSYLESIHCG